MLSQAQSHTAADVPDLPWEAQLAEAILVLYKAEQAEGDSCTPGLSLLFEDAAFAKLSATSSKVNSAAATARRLKRDHSAELLGQDLLVGSEDFEALLATFVQQKVLHLQLEIERMVRVRMDADALMPALAERPADQARLKKTLLRSASAIDSKAARLKMWVTGSFVREAMLAEEVRALRETAPAWDIGTFRHGVFPWDRDDFADSESSRAQLVSRLVLHSREKRRCKEELELLQREKQSTLQLYEKQTAALRGGLAAIERDLAALQPGSSTTACAAASRSEADPSSASTRSRHNAAGMLMGKRLLMEQRLQRVLRIADAAAAAFGSTDMSQALRQADQCALDFVECVPECVEAEDGTVLVVADAEEGLSSDDDAP